MKKEERLKWLQEEKNMLAESKAEIRIFLINKGIDPEMIHNVLSTMRVKEHESSNI